MIKNLIDELRSLLERHPQNDDITLDRYSQDMRKITRN